MKPVRVVSIILLLQATAYYLFPKSEILRASLPLENLPMQAGVWKAVSSQPVEPEINDVLKADSTVTRVYVRPADQLPLALFVAFFKTQAAGVAPHSPKNCLPGSGWVPTESRIAALPVPDRADPIQVNHYIVQRGEEKSLVLYWYQTGDRVVASEYSAKLYTALDRLTQKRSDTSIVRIVVPVGPKGEPASLEAAGDFAAAFYPQIVSILPR